MTVVSKGLVHVIAECRVCGKRWEDYMTAQQRASNHASKTGHRVVADLGYTVEYGAAKRSKKRKVRK